MTPEREAELVVQQRRISTINREITDLINQRHAAEQKITELKSWQPNSAAILAARHLTPGEGPMRTGHVVTGTDVSALNTVIRFVARHKNCEGK